MPEFDSIGHGTEPTRSCDPYLKGPDGIWRHPKASSHREADYDERGIGALARMQREHFWYSGRHRFLEVAFRWVLNETVHPSPCVLDAGAGAGGWVSQLLNRASLPNVRLAAGDSSEVSLAYLANMRGLDKAYHLDLMQLYWTDHWDCIFSLDVIEHLEDDQKALAELYRALRPGGYLILAVPALHFFWSYNDEFARHKRRYNKDDIKGLAMSAGFEVVRQRYFMFLLSPLLWLSRLKKPLLDESDPVAVSEYLEATHRVPHPVMNKLLAAIFSLESPLGWYLPFPWGTSLMAVLRKPSL